MISRLSVRRLQLACHRDRQALVGELIDDVEQLELAAIMGAVLNEVVTLRWHSSRYAAGTLASSAQTWFGRSGRRAGHRSCQPAKAARACADAAALSAPHASSRSAPPAWRSPANLPPAVGLKISSGILGHVAALAPEKGRQQLVSYLNGYRPRQLRGADFFSGSRLRRSPMLRMGAMSMPVSVISFFTNPDDYEAALGEDAEVNMLVTGRGEFWAELSRIGLPRLSLSAGTEHLARVAAITVGSDLVRISLPGRGRSFLISGGIPFQPGEIVAHGPGHRLLERTEGRCRWRSIWLPAKDLAAYSRAVTGAALQIPPGEGRWRPRPAALRSLISLHDDAIRLTAVLPGVTKDAQAANGLEQQLILGLIECLPVEMALAGTAVQERQARIMLRFEESLQARAGRKTDICDICAAVGVPSRTFRAYCHAQLGMAPSRYIRLRRLKMTHRAL
jgi:hypothetical protein